MTEARSPSRAAGADRLVAFADRATILALASRRRERPRVDPQELLLAAHSADERPERRLLRWASGQPDEPECRAAVASVFRRGAAVAALALGIAALLGWFAGSAALGLPEAGSIAPGAPGAPVSAAAGSVNIVWILQGVLLGQSLLLAAWVGLQTFGQGAAWASIGGAVSALGLAAARRAGRVEGPLAAAAAAVTSLAWRGASGRWTIGAATHALWLAFNLGCLLAIALRLTFHRYAFTWESTWMPDAWFAALCSAASAVPRWLGVPTPDAAMIAASERGAPGSLDQPREIRQAWTGLLLGSIVVYGVIPRALLAIGCIAMARRAQRAVRLDPTSLFLDPILRRIDAAGDASTGPRSGAWPAAPDAALPAAAGAAAVGPPAVVGIEIAIPASGWPPAAARGAEDLGIVAGGDDRRAALDRLHSLAPRPRRIVLVAPLAAAPDRGLATTIEEIVVAAATDARLVLTGGSTARRRLDGEALRRRVDGWRAVAARAGIRGASVIELDLDLLTAATAARLRAIVAGEESASGAPDQSARGDAPADGAQRPAPAPSQEAGEDAREESNEDAREDARATDRAQGGGSRADVGADRRALAGERFAIDRERLRDAFDLIARRCADEGGDETAALLRLHHELSELYGAAEGRPATESPVERLRSRWLAGIALPAIVDPDARTLRSAGSKLPGAALGDFVPDVSHLSKLAGLGARSMLARLPASMAGSARWGAAGAIAGALGCITIATMAGPALGSAAVVGILSALPGWLGAGAGSGALAGLVRSMRSADGGSSTAAERDSAAIASVAEARATAVRAAALWAATLALQGEEEAAIARALGSAFGDPTEMGEMGEGSGVGATPPAHAAGVAAGSAPGAHAASSAPASRNDAPLEGLEAEFARIDGAGAEAAAERRRAAIGRRLRATRARLIDASDRIDDLDSPDRWRAR
ncbi:MAG TPA: DUF2868 domain-containing protein [Phycisphaerales bacterium]|nr:DUF2868 domain-containing protein [Phycisphaerales bacterium]HMP37936.1 DUF2868 domain-containing protein [Phycisphaerales bacterium]